MENKKDVMTRLPTADELTPEMLKGLPDLPEDKAKELSEGYTTAFSVDDPADRKFLLDTVKDIETTLSKQYKMPDNKYTLGNAVGNVASLFSVSEIPKRIAAAPLGYSTTKMAPPTADIARGYGVGEGPTYGDIGPSKEALENFASYMKPVGMMGVGTKVLNKDGPLKNLSALDVGGFAADVAPDMIPGSQLLTAPGLIGKVGAKAAANSPKMAFVANAIKNVVGQPVKSASEKLRSILIKTPKADEAVRKAGKGEGAISQIVDDFDIWGTAPAADKKYKAVMQAHTDQAEAIIKDSEKKGTEALNQYVANLPIEQLTSGKIPYKPELPYIDMQDVVMRARQRIAERARLAGASEEDAAAVAKVLDTMEGKIPMDMPNAPHPEFQKIAEGGGGSGPYAGVGGPVETMQIPTAKYLDEQAKYMSDVEKEIARVQKKKGALELMQNARGGESYMYRLSDAQELKKIMQRSHANRYKQQVAGAPPTNFMADAEHDIAEALKEALEAKTDLINPAQAGALKESNRISGTMLMGYENFRRDIKATTPMAENLVTMGAPIVAGAARTAAKGSVLPLVGGVALGAGVGAVRNTNLGKTGLAQVLKKSQKLPLDTASRAILNLSLGPNAYEELIRQREKARKEEGNK